MTTIKTLIDAYGLIPHPEGGFYIESFRSSQIVTTSEGYLRSAGTAIYFLMCEDHLSRLHRIQSDEIWHFYKGSSIKIVELVDDGFKETELGPDLLQYTVSANTWFGSYPTDNYSFVGCTVSPGFDFADFELGSRSKLLAEFPKANSIIEKLTIGLP